MFGYGTGASGARALDQDDVDTVLGFDIETTTLSSTYTAKGKIWEPGAQVTLSWSGTSHYPTYSTSSTKSVSLSDSLTEYHRIFWYYDDGWKYSDYSSTPETIATIENKYTYWYYGTDLMSNDSEEYKLIFDCAASRGYFLGTANCGVSTASVQFRLVLRCRRLCG